MTIAETLGVAAPPPFFNDVQGSDHDIDAGAEVRPALDRQRAEEQHPLKGNVLQIRIEIDASEVAGIDSTEVILSAVVMAAPPRFARAQNQVG